MNSIFKIEDSKIINNTAKEYSGGMEISNGKDVNINKTALDDFINILISSADNYESAKDMSDDEFLKYIQNLKRKK